MPSRRSLLGGLLLSAGLPAAALAQEKARAKVSQAAARYQDRPVDIWSCALCAQFVAPDQCKVIEGKVSADGWCALFELVD